MSNTNTGGPAFPGPYANESGTIEVLWKQRGMTLRDYFAAKAMPTVIADWLNHGDIFTDVDVSELIARDCYIVADSMLKAREA